MLLDKSRCDMTENWDGTILLEALAVSGRRLPRGTSGWVLSPSNVLSPSEQNLSKHPEGGALSDDVRWKPLHPDR